MQEKSIFNAGKVVNSFYLPVSWWNCFAVKYTDENVVIISKESLYSMRKRSDNLLSA